MWYNDIYFHRRDWLIENYKKLEITERELVTLLKIDLLNQKQENITMDYLCDELNLKTNELNIVIQTLSDKKLLNIKYNRKKIIFNIDSVFKKESKSSESIHPLVELIEDSFGRPLSQNELSSLNNLHQQFDYDVIIYGIRQCIIQNKLSFKYLEKVVYNASNETTT